MEDILEERDPTTWFHLVDKAAVSGEGAQT
jgi:hypothetical protein